MKSSLRAVIEAGGGATLSGRFISGVPAFKGKKAYYLVFFNSPDTGSTMCMKLLGLTAEKVREHIKESNLKFGIGKA